MTFSTNQVRHLYVVKSAPTSVEKTSDAGALAVKTDLAKSHLYFEYMSPGGLVRSDLIDIKNIIAAKATDAESLKRELSQVKVSLDSAVNGGKPVPGQEYLLRIAIRQYAGMSDEDQYFKHGLVKATGEMVTDVEKFYVKLKDSLIMNFSREASKLLDFKADATGVTITEVPQEWKRGVLAQVPVYFDVHPTTILVGGVDEIWGTATRTHSNSYVGNGKNIADLEYFCMGERGDHYRNNGWPYVIETTYLVDPETEYSVLDIHYAYVGSNENVQKSERDITLVGSKDDINTIIGEINTAAGTSIATLD